MTKQEYIKKILELKPYSMSLLFQQSLSELKEIYKKLKSGLDPGEVKPIYKKYPYTKQVDDLGRIQIPKRYRMLLNIKQGDSVMIKKFNGALIIRKVEDEE